MIFARGRVRHDGIGNAAVGYLVLAHFHRRRHHRCHGLDARNIDFRKLLDKSEHGIELTAKVLDLIIGNRYARKVRNPADGIGVNGHAKALAFNRNAGRGYTRGGGASQRPVPAFGRRIAQKARSI